MLILYIYRAFFITYSRYTEGAARVEKLLHDKPTDGLRRAVWWIEYVIRHGGAPHLRSPALDISWCSYLMLDVLAAVALALAVFFLALYLFVKLVVKIVCKVLCIKTSKKVKKQ